MARKKQEMENGYDLFPETEEQEKKEMTLTEKLKSLGTIQIKPLFDPNKPNMGLEKYGLILFPDTYHEEQLAAIEVNGVIKYLTGLDEFSPSVQTLPEEQKNARIKEIRSIVAYLERTLNSNVIDENDPEFWKKATMIIPNNQKFWEKITVRCGNEPVVLQPLKDPYDLIKLMAIEAGGFDMIGKSYEDAMARPKAPLFFLDKENKESIIKTSFKKLRNKAIVLLDNIYNKDRDKLLYLTKVLDSNSVRYDFSTPLDILYGVLDDFINGEGEETNKTKAAEKFISTSKIEVSELKIKALVKDASFFKYIVNKPDGMLYYSKTGTMLGRNISDVVAFLQNPLNEDVLTQLLNAVEPHWYTN